MRAVTAPPSLDLTLGTSASLLLLHNLWQQYCTLYYTIVLLCVVLFSSDMHTQAWLKLLFLHFGTSNTNQNISAYSCCHFAADIACFESRIFLNNPFFNLFLYNVIFS